MPVLIGPFPAPYHGVTITNDKFQRLIQSKGLDCECINLSPGREKKDAQYVWTRTSRAISGFFRVLFAPASKCRNYEMSVDGGSGLIYNILIAAAVRLRGAPLLLYHHSTRYVLADSMLMRVLLCVVGKNALHMMCSRRMFEMFMHRYGTPDRFLHLSNAAWIDPSPVAQQPPNSDWVSLGYLSALSEEKGALRALAAFRAVRRSGVRAKFHIAGVNMTKAVEQAIDEARQEFGDDIVYLGTILNEQKLQFLASLDFFLFPTLYPHETQSSVASEAMASGVPVIALDHRFVGELVGTDGGLLIPVDADYAEAAADWIAARGTVAGRLACRELVRAHYGRIYAEATGQLDLVVRLLADVDKFKTASVA